MFRIPWWEAGPSPEVNTGTHVREGAASCRGWVRWGRPRVSSNVTWVRLRVNQPLQVTRSLTPRLPLSPPWWGRRMKHLLRRVASEVHGPADPASHTEHLILDTGVPVLPGAVLHARGPTCPPSPTSSLMARLSTKGPGQTRLCQRLLGPPDSHPPSCNGCDALFPCLPD